MIAVFSVACSQTCFVRLSQPSNVADTLVFLQTIVVPKRADDNADVEKLFANVFEISPEVINIRTDSRLIEVVK